MKQCLKCSTEISARRKFCSDHCKWWYNLIKKEKEAHLPPLKKRNKQFFSMIVGYEVAKMSGGMRQGRRAGGMVVGSMSARINCTIEKWVELNVENLVTHFSSISFYRPTYIRLGDDTRILEQNIKSETGIDWVAQQ